MATYFSHLSTVWSLNSIKEKPTKFKELKPHQILLLLEEISPLGMQVQRELQDWPLTVCLIALGSGRKQALC